MKRVPKQMEKFVVQREVVIVEAVRTPVGRAGGSLASTHPADLLAVALRSVVERSRVPVETIEQVIGGCVGQSGAQSSNISRTAALIAGLAIETAATTVDAQCGSSQQAFNLAVGLVGSGAVDTAIACGVESMSTVPLGASVKAGPGRAYPKSYFSKFDYFNQFEAADRIGAEWNISRADVDLFGLSSQVKAAAAWAGGHFDREVVGVPLLSEGSPVGEFTRDECLRETSLDALAGLRTVRENGLHTAGTSSKTSDGAAAVLLMTKERAQELSMVPKARVVDHCLVGSDPLLMLTGPIPATQRLLRRTGMTIDDLDLIEINEAFASVVLAWSREVGADLAKVNPNGGAIALGHPLGGTGCKLVTSAVHELERADAEMALVTMCCGGGLGTGTVLQRC